MSDQEYNLTLFEACEYLTKSRSSITRYVRHGLLHPLSITSRQGTLEYRFSKDDLDALREHLSDEATQRTLANAEHATQVTQVREVTETETAQTKENTDAPDHSGDAEHADDARHGGVLEQLKEQVQELREDKRHLREELKEKNTQIEKFQERDREHNILIRDLTQRLELAAPQQVRDAEQAGHADNAEAPITHQETENGNQDN